MCHHNHRRYKSGKRQGKAPIELLTGEALEADWVELLRQHTQETSQGASLTSSAPLELIPIAMSIQGHLRRPQAKRS